MTAAEKTWTVNDIKEAMIAEGSHWWDRETMRFFGTRVLPTVYQGTGGIFFVTSEQPPHGPRAFTVRQWLPEGAKIDTIGDLASMNRVAAIRTAKSMAGSVAQEIVEPLAGQDAAPVSHVGLIDAMLRKAANHSGDKTGWGKRHVAAWRLNQGTNVELTIVQMVTGLATYADLHRARFETGIGDDGFLGPIWETMVKSVRGLLNGECGRLDCGLLDGLLCSMLDAEGFGE